MPLVAAQQLAIQLGDVGHPNVTADEVAEPLQITPISADGAGRGVPVQFQPGQVLIDRSGQRRGRHPLTLAITITFRNHNFTELSRRVQPHQIMRVLTKPASRRLVAATAYRPTRAGTSSPPRPCVHLFENQRIVNSVARRRALLTSGQT